MTSVLSFEDLNLDSKLNFEPALKERKTTLKLESKTESFDAVIPPFIRKWCTSPNSFEVHLSHNASTNLTSYQYSVTWDFEKNDSEVSTKDVHRKKVDSDILASLASERSTFKSLLSKDSLGKNEKPNANSIKTENNSLETSRSTHSTITKPSFKQTYPTENEIISAKLVIAEPAEGYGMTFSYVKVKANSSESIMKPISKMLVKTNRDVAKYLETGTLYYAEIQPDMEREMRLIHKKKYNSTNVLKIPKIGNYVVFVLDLGEYVENGTRIYFK